MSWVLIIGMLFTMYIVGAMFWFVMGRPPQNEELFGHMFILLILSFIFVVPVSIVYVNLTGMLASASYEPMLDCSRSAKCPLSLVELVYMAGFGLLIYWQSYIAGISINHVYENA